MIEIRFQFEGCTFTGVDSTLPFWDKCTVSRSASKETLIDASRSVIEKMENFVALIFEDILRSKVNEYMSREDFGVLWGNTSLRVRNPTINFSTSSKANEVEFSFGTFKWPITQVMASLQKIWERIIKLIASMFRKVASIDDEAGNNDIWRSNDETKRAFADQMMTTQLDRLERRKSDCDCDWLDDQIAGHD